MFLRSLMRLFVDSLARLFFRSFVHLLDRLFLSSFTSSRVRAFVCSFVRSLVCLFVRSFVRSFVLSFIRLLVRSFVRSFVRLLVRSFVCSFVRSFARSFVRSFVRSFLRDKSSKHTIWLYYEMFTHSHYFVISLNQNVNGLIFFVMIDVLCCRIRELYEPAELSYCENAAVLFDLLAQRLSISKQSKAISLLQEAFPDMQYKEVGDCQMLFGIRPKNNVEDVEFPEFTEEEDSVSDEVLHCLDGNSTMNEALNKRVSREQLANTSSTVASTPGALSSFCLL